MALNDHRRLHSSKSFEWYTPKIYLAAVHAVMGGIDLDPASSAQANRTVRAQRFYSIEDDGLSQPWYGRVFLNPPYGSVGGKSNQARWGHHLIAEYKAGTVTEAILLVNAVPGNKWFAPLWQFPICFVRRRIRFELPTDTKNAPTHSNVFVYMGENRECFRDVFAQFGVIAVAM